MVNNIMYVRLARENTDAYGGGLSMDLWICICFMYLTCAGGGQI